MQMSVSVCWDQLFDESVEVVINSVCKYFCESLHTKVKGAVD